MKFFIVLSALAAVALAKPYVRLEHAHSLPVAHVATPLTYAAPHAYVKLVPGAPIGHDGRVVDTPEVAHAKAAHESAHVHEKIALARELAKSHDEYSYEAPAHLAATYHAKTYAVPVAHHAVAYQAAPVAHSSVSYHAKTYAVPVAHTASYHAAAPVVYTKVVPAAPIGHDGQVVDTVEVAHAKAAHAAAHVAEKANLAHESAKSAHYPEIHLASAVSYAPHYYAVSHESHY